MAMAQGFDLSRFKKVSSDAKSTTMRHANGHEVKIVHAALSPAMRQQVDALPAHQEPVKMAKGGMIKKMADGGEAAPAPADDLPPGADMSAINAANRPAGIPPPPDAPVSNDQAPSAAADQASPAPTPPPDSSNVPVIDVTGQKPAAPTMQSLTAEQQAWQNDLTNGHVTPETYQSLYGKKDTLGKIGTIFGLLIGGAPSNNMAFQMMDKQIHNDLQAQIQSKSNAVNYYNAATNMAQGMANADQIAANTALVNMRTGVYQKLLGDAGHMSPGPGQQRAQALLQQMLPVMNQENMKNNAQAVMNAHRGGAPNFDGPVNFGAAKALEAFAPDLAGGAQQEAQHVWQTRQLFDNYTHAHTRLNTITAGQGSEALKQAADAAAGFIPMSSLAGSVADLAKNLQQERQAEIQAMPGVPQEFLPAGYDYVPGVGGDRTRAEKANRAAAWFKLQEGPASTLNTLQNTGGYNMIKPAPYEDWAKSMGQKMQPKGIGGRKQPLATPEEAAKGNVFPEPPEGGE